MSKEKLYTISPQCEETKAIDARNDDMYIVHSIWKHHTNASNIHSYGLSYLVEHDWGSLPRNAVLPVVVGGVHRGAAEHASNSAGGIRTIISDATPGRRRTDVTGVVVGQEGLHSHKLQHMSLLDFVDAMKLNTCQPDPSSIFFFISQQDRSISKNERCTEYNTTHWMTTFQGRYK